MKMLKRMDPRTDHWGTPTNFFPFTKRALNFTELMVSICKIALHEQGSV